MRATVLLLAAPAVAQGPVPPAPAALPGPAAAAGVARPGTATTATIAILDKRSGTVTDVTVGPDTPFRVGRLSGVMRTCERTQPGTRRETAAFLEIDEAPRASEGRRAGRPRRVFSGWMFAESPSLNPFGHPAYDVWLRNCTIREPAPSPPPRTASKQAQSAASGSASASSER